MTSPQLVSVVFPVFNAAGTLEAALESLRRQTHAQWECLVLDDGSSDGSADRAEDLARGDSRLRVLRLGRVGLVEALNTGLGAAAGPFIARMDADDVMRRDRLARQLQELRSDPGLALVGSHVRLFPRHHLTAYRRDYEAWLNSLTTEALVRRDAFIECPLAHPTWMARADVLRRVCYRDMGWPEDYDVLLRLMTSGHRIGTVPERLLAWRDGAGRASRVDPRYAPARFTACKAAHLADTFLAGVDRYVLWGYGNTGRHMRRALMPHGKHPSAIVEVKASRIGQRIHGAPVLSVEQWRAWPRDPLLVSVARSAPRATVRAALADMGLRELHDYVCVA